MGEASSAGLCSAAELLAVMSGGRLRRALQEAAEGRPSSAGGEVLGRCASGGAFAGAEVGSSVPRPLSPPPGLAGVVHGGSAAEPAVLLSVAGLRALRHERKSRTLQVDARAALESAVQFFSVFADEVAAPPYDVRTVWPEWKRYLAWHEQGEEIVGPGVAQLQAEQIRGVTDPNRCGALRVDIVVYNVDGGYWRLHPGSKRRGDAVPRHFSVSATELDARGRQTAAVFYRAFIGVFDSGKAAAIPQHDRLGRSEFLDCVGRAGAEHPCDLTESDNVPWRRWFCNLGRETRRVIGPGIRRVMLESLVPDEASRRVRCATFHAECVDDTKWTVCVFQWRQWVDGTLQRHYGHWIDETEVFRCGQTWMWSQRCDQKSL